MPIQQIVLTDNREPADNRQDIGERNAHKGTSMAKGRQRLCRICHKNPVWTHGDVTDAQGTCKKCYHKHVWTGRPQRKRDQMGVTREGSEPKALWELGMEVEIEALGRGVDPEDLW